MYKYYNIDSSRVYQNQYKSKQKTHSDIYTSVYIHDDKKEPLFQYYKECFNRINETDYMKKRGLSEAVLKKFNIGYDPNYNAGFEKWKAIIIPLNAYSCVVRNTDFTATKDNRYRKKGTTAIFNEEVLKTSNMPIYVCEGEIDALSIIEAGGEAIALSSANNYRILLENIKKNKPIKPLLVSLDNDETGEKTTESLVKGLEELNAPYYLYNPCGESDDGLYKDANEALLGDRSGFISRVLKGNNVENEIEEAKKGEYLKNSAINHIQLFLDEIIESANRSCISTGFKALDNQLDGGAV